MAQSTNSSGLTQRISRLFYPKGSKRGRIRRLGLPGPAGGTANLALARAAYDRGNYLRVCELLAKDWDSSPISAQMLFADACTELGTADGDEASVAVFEKLSQHLKDEWTQRRDALRQAVQAQDDQQPVDESLWGWGQDVEDLTWRERAILHGFLQQRPDLLQLRSDLAPPTDESKSSDSAAPKTVIDRFSDTWFLWEKLSRRVSDDKTEAEKNRKLWQRIEVVLSLISAGLAAGAGGVALKGAAGSGSTGKTQWVIFGLSIASALVSTLIVSLKPGERAKTASKQADALEQISAAMDLFQNDQSEADAEKRGAELVKAITEVRRRSRAAKGLSPPQKLV